MLALLACLAYLRLALAEDTRIITYQGDDGETLYLADNRRPALYTGNFGDCMGDSVINVTRFDAAYYKDIGVYANGESRFDLTFNPCDANIAR
jgi:hypothetical protein